ncbi:ectoine/hydroxyectoine ABC transporter substrate-binding protein EhuB [Nocardioides marmoriginsengisoli]|uniref:ectoine/hydroxyectoine ABC transporter substrate-binding protein EhuB n=1 Tax=Nocardioides marmoriginsengisoli TaxID=661483 RepID=UPI00160D3907|nr:ectoine/hydroxyectoine ABC transporter substrate-binding protein EhuB [Nocardioides marmoriginsengisoli]
MASASLAALVLATAGCGSSDKESASNSAGSLAELKKTGTIRSAFINAKPLAYMDEKSGLLDGSGPTVLKAIMTSIGVKNVDPILTEFDAIIPGLKANRWRMSAFPFYVTPERCKEVAFTNPTAQYLEGALVQSGNPLGLASYKDLAKPGVRVGIQSGNAEIEWAKDNGVKQSQIKLFSEEALAVEAVRNKQIDVYLNAEFSVIQALKTYGDKGLEMASPFEGPIVDGKEVVAYGAWALGSDDNELREAFNEKLAEMLASGELLKLQEPFGYNADAMPDPAVTSASLCPDADWAK